MSRFVEQTRAKEGRAWRAISSVLQRLGETLGVPVEANRVHQALADASSQLFLSDEGDSVLFMVRAAQSVGLRIAPVELSLNDLWATVAEGIPVATSQSLDSTGNWIVLTRLVGNRATVELVSDDRIEERVVTRNELGKLLSLRKAADRRQFFIAQTSSLSRELESHEDGHHDEHHHMDPLKRLIALWRLDSRDIFTLTLFAVVVSLLGLAVPIAVEALVNTVLFQRYFQPILVISVILFTFLAFSGFLRLLQSFVAEIIQRRIFVRFVGDFAYRLPRAKLTTWDQYQGQELANRFFDVINIQKASALLLLDGIMLVLQTVVGMALLAFYHPFLLGFDIVLLVVMAIILFVMGRGGVATAQDESYIKYRIAHWLQDVAAHPTAFKIHGGQQLAVDRANRLTVEFLEARSQHFRVLWRQILFSMMAYAVASTSLLGLGGYLVIIGRLNPGQLVAAELVVAVIVGSFTKLGKLLETYYDLLASVHKVGYLLDVVIDPPGRAFEFGTGAASLRWSGLSVHLGSSENTIHFPDFEMKPGDTLAINGASGTGKSILAQLISGIRAADHGFIEVAGLDVREAARLSDGSMVGLAGVPEVFNGSVSENVHVGRPNVTDADVRDALQRVGLWEEILNLPDGMETQLLSGGKPLSRGQLDRLMIARAMVGRPRVLVIDAALDSLPPAQRQLLWKNLTTAQDIRTTGKPWTLVLITNEADLIEHCDHLVDLSATHEMGNSAKLDPRTLNV